jgi:hypothetical protein
MTLFITTAVSRGKWGGGGQPLFWQTISDRRFLLVVTSSAWIGEMEQRIPSLVPGTVTETAECVCFMLPCLKTLRTAHKNSRVCVSNVADRSQEFSFLTHVSFVHPLHWSHELHTSIYCVAVLSHICSSVGYHDLARNHVSL